MRENGAAIAAIRLAISRGLRFDADANGIVVLGDRAALAEIHDALAPHLHVIGELIGAAIVAAKAGDKVSAATLLRYGLWAPLPPADCPFFVGTAAATCRRCGASWQQHLEHQGLNRQEPAYSRWLARNERTDDTFVPDDE